MDTLSRDSSSSNNSIVPLIGVGAGVIALLLSIVALVKISKLEKAMVAHDEEITNKVTSIENDVRSAAAKSDTDIKGLKDGVQNALNQVGTEIGAIRAQVTKLEESAKKAPVAAGKGGKGGGGTVDANGNYTVGKGDKSLAGIARKFGVTVDAIQAENPGLGTKIHAGQKIKIPKK